MKVIREFRTAGDFFYCDCHFIPDDQSDDNEIEDLDIFGLHLRMSFLIRYPKRIIDKPRTRFACIAHPNLSPVLVAQEASRFLSLINQMISL